MGKNNDKRLPSLKLKAGDMNGPLYIEKIEAIKRTNGKSAYQATCLCECGLVTKKAMADLNRNKYRSCSKKCPLFSKIARRSAVAMHRKKWAKEKEARPVVVKQLVGLPRIKVVSATNSNVLDLDSFIQKRIEAKRIQLRQEIIAHIENFKFGSN